jgi:hypothetical protein
MDHLNRALRMLADARFTSSQYGEDFLTSSREGEEE